MNDDSRNKVYLGFTLAILLLVLVGGWLAFKPKYDRYRMLKEEDARKSREIDDTVRRTIELNDRTKELPRNPDKARDVAQGSGRYPENVEVFDFSEKNRR
ncbi:MAG: hypothetical protein K6F50_10335 [Kiritimatiellae bacterium]|nr:hypothetical protein [Kiritimatiellia bacterium]